MLKAVKIQVDDDSKAASPSTPLPGPVPPIKPLSYISYVRAARRNLLETYHQACFTQDVIETRFPGFHNFIINDPAGIKRVLLDNVDNYPKADIEHRILGPLLGKGLITSEGPMWRAHRRIMAPVFDHRSIESYAPTMRQAGEVLQSRWSVLPSGAVLDISDEMMRLTLDVISRSMFSSDSESMVDIVRDSAERYQKAMMFGLLDFVPGIKSVWGVIKARSGRRLLRDLDAAMYELIARRSHSHDIGAGRDLLDKLLTRDAYGAGMSAQEIRDEVLTIFAAGHETTARALAWTWLLLAMHPAEEATLHEELNRVLRGRTPTYEDLERLPYTRMILQESMRLYPAVYTLAWRQAAATDVVGGRIIPKGATVSIVPWILHRHQSFWECPGRFRPTRFTAEAIKKRDRFAYLPFSFGRRVCIGASFAMAEGTLLLAMIAQRYRLRLVANAMIQPRGLITLTSYNGMPMKLEQR